MRPSTGSARSMDDDEPPTVRTSAMRRQGEATSSVSVAVETPAGTSSAAPVGFARPGAAGSCPIGTYCASNGCAEAGTFGGNLSGPSTAATPPDPRMEKPPFRSYSKPTVVDDQRKLIVVQAAAKPVGSPLLYMYSNANPTSPIRSPPMIGTDSGTSTDAWALMARSPWLLNWISPLTSNAPSNIETSTVRA